MSELHHDVRQRTDIPRADTPQNLYGELDESVDKIGITPAHYKIFTLVALGSLFNAVEEYNVGYAAPHIVKQWNVSQFSIGLLSAVTFIAMAVGSLISGVVGDRMGRRLIFMVNLAVFTFGALLAAVAPSYEVLLLARILVGIGLGGEISLGYTVVSEMVPTRQRGPMTSALNFVASGIGVFAASGLAALMLGPLLPALGGEEMAWRWFFGVMFLPALLILFYRRYLPETPRYLLRRGEVDATNRVLSILASGRLRASKTLTITRYLSVPDGTRPSVEVGTSAGLSALFHRSIVRSTVVGWMLTLLIFGGFVVLNIFMPTVLVARGFDIGTSLALSTIINIGGLCGGLAGMVASGRVPRRIMFTVAPLLAVVLMVCFAVTSNSIITVVTAAGVTAAFQASSATLWAYLPELFPTRLRALGTGSCATVGLLAAGVLPLLAGALLDTFGTVGVYVLIGGLCLAVPGVAMLGRETFGRALDES